LFRRSWALQVVASCLAGCALAGEERHSERSAELVDAAAPASTQTVASVRAAEPARAADEIVLLAGGDVSFGRALGDTLLADPTYDFFAPTAAMLDAADVRFVNLESQLSDQGGRTVHPDNRLIFTGPPSGADALARGRVDLVSLANNHAWDFGKAAFLETLEHLERAGVGYVGAGRTRDRAYGPVIIDRAGFRLAFLAVTDIWNQGSLAAHEASEHVAQAKHETLVEAVRLLRASNRADAIVVSYHGGEEYFDAPLQRQRDLLRATIDAGADAVLGHHPHVVQGVEWRGGRPIFYSLGNYLMRMTSSEPMTGLGFLARLRFERGAAPEVEACPYRIVGIDAIPVAAMGDAKVHERMFARHIDSISRAFGGVEVGPIGGGGCARMGPR
jgi:poly-gamma-glutamate capsule biosynthesis protein CapA/YwtB (metallophosphatase superfamily)